MTLTSFIQTSYIQSHASKRIQMLVISRAVSIPHEEITLNGIRAQGSGGQNVNKVSSAIHLRFDFLKSSLPDHYKQRLANFSDSRITKDGVIVIKAQTYRTQEQNKEDALNRLRELIQSAVAIQKTRKPTKPTYGSKLKRLDNKTKRGRTKSLRKKISP